MVASAADRVALVIGNSAYEQGRLTNPVNDATDVAAALRALGFEVMLATNQDRAGMLEQLDAFAARIRPGGLALFYFAGHGMELGGENWLLPVRNKGIDTQGKVRIHSVSADTVLQSMEERGAALNVLVLDACRDNPLPSGARSAQRGFRPMTVGTSTLVAYSTSPGNTAADGEGQRNSPYTRALLQALKGEDVAIPDLFGRAGKSVVDATAGAQVPWTSNTPIWPPVVLAGRGVVQQPSPSVSPGEGELRIEVSPSGATVRLDGVLLGTGSRRVLQLSGKTVLVRAEAAGHEAIEERVLVQGGQVADVVLRLKPLVAAPPDPVRPEPVTARPDPAPVPATVSPGVEATAIDRSAPTPTVGQAYRRRLKSGGEGPEMVVVPGGSYLRGSPANEQGRRSGEGPQRQVTIRSFAIGVTELTFADWDRCVSAGGCEHRPDDKGWGRGDRPVNGVSWDDAQAYARWLSGETGRRYRLPSESEWEYAARAETVTAYWWGNGIDRSRANYGTEACCGAKADGADRWEYMAPVKSFPGNPWGVYDMSGNLSEWVQDCYKYSYRDAPTDGRAVEAGVCDKRVLRGGAWYHEPASLRSAARDDWFLTGRLAFIGFRLAEDL